MTVIDFLTSGGMIHSDGDFSENQREEIKNLIKQFADIVFKQGKELQIRDSALTIKQATHLLIGEDLGYRHILFVIKKEQNWIGYKSLDDLVPLEKLVDQTKKEIGEVVCAFSISRYFPKEITQKAEQYIKSAILQAQLQESTDNPEIASGIEKFRRDYPQGQKIAFIIMRFGKTEIYEEILKNIREILSRYNIKALRADEKEYMDDLFPNVEVYLRTCNFGIAIYEKISTNDFNPNVSLEVGYLLGMNKNVLLLKAKTLLALHTDFAGKLYKEFDTDNVKETIKQSLEKWLSDKGYI